MDLPRIDSVSSPPTYADSGTPGYFTDASATPTVLSAQVLNHIVRELLGILTGLGGSIDPLDDQQIAPLLLARIAGATPESVEATKDEHTYSATVTGWVTRVVCEDAENGEYVMIWHPTGRIPLSVTCHGTPPVSAAAERMRHDDEGLLLVFFENIAETTNVHVIVIWGTAP